MLDVAESSGLISGTVAGALRGGFGLLGGLTGGGSDNTIRVPLDFSDGVTRLGPVTIGPAPRLAQRG